MWLRSAGVAVLVVGCSSGSTPPPNLGEVCSAPSASPSGLSDVESGNASFAVSFFDSQADAGTNLVLSPYSVSMALDLAYAGAATATASQMAQVLGLGSAASNPGPEMASIACTAESDGTQSGNQLDVANTLFGQQGITFESAFLSTLRTNYGAPLQTVNFADASSAAATIDGWVSTQTEGMIPNLLSPGDIEDRTELVLVNALYFKGNWENGFDPSQTTPQPFQVDAATSVPVPMMSQTSKATFGYFVGDGVAIAELPYQGGKIALDVILPSDLGSLTSTLTASQLQSWFAQLRQTQFAELEVPRFKIDTHADLASALKGLGMPLPFTPYAADFSGMDGAHDLYIKHVIHEAVIDVDESGTTAAAATAVTVGPASVVTRGPVLPSFIADSPFLFVLRDSSTGTLLFVGQVVNPAS